MRIKNNFFSKDVLDICPKLLGKTLVRVFPDSKKIKYIITEIEAYKGEEDLGCHASRGKTQRNSVMYEKAGLIYVYLIYGMYWMLNIVTGEKDNPQAILIRGLKNINETKSGSKNILGPGRVGKILNLDKSFYGEDIGKSKRVWIEDSTKEKSPNNKKIKYKRLPRVGIDYAGKWAKKPWRYVLID